MSDYFARGEHLYCFCSENMLEGRLLIASVLWSTLSLFFYVDDFKMGQKLIAMKTR